ncbi:MAG TPA: sodium-translocating pyrophosphatase, partial [Acidimicrobiales bacterium]|nr:sodium-translocating pyrophosphatase [Acidimicrobiales bacterium]
MDSVPYLAVVAALAGLGLAFYFFGVVKKASPGDARMVELMEAIQEGSRAFLRREYQAVAIFVVVLSVLIALLLDNGLYAAGAYLVGAVFSALAGFIGMTVATMANARTAEAAKSGAQVALPLAFRGGAVMGFTVAGLSLIGVAAAYILFVDVLTIENPIQVVTTYSLGASSIALFARIGGGIYTKAADVGADLVGKVEAGIPEDDPRNPATIADNVGDNVGDVAGMGADLFESYAGSLIAPIALAGFAFADTVDGVPAGFQESALLYPLAIATFGMLAAIVGAFTVRTGPGATGRDLAKALHRGTYVAAGFTVVLAFVLGWWLFGDITDRWWGFPIAVVAGLLAGLAIGKLCEYYTSDHYQPVKDIAASSETGSATTILAGIATGKISVTGSVLLVVAAIGAAYAGAEYALPDLANSGIYGVAISGIGMLATLGVVVATDAYGPIADNAGGIAEMAHLDPSVREVTDELDALGNTTAAVAKGFAIGSAVLTALALFVSFQESIRASGGEITLNIGDVDVFVGLFIGAMLPFLFAALTMNAVGRAANQMIEEVRRQFREIPGLREGREGVVPEYAKCVDISTSAALKEMIVPGSLAVVVPLVVGFISVDALGGLLAGVLVTGFAIAIYMANAGGAWDNAKKYIEAGHHGGKGSEPHKAAVVGDTVGDPFKDTSGPAMNILIKVMTVVALIFAPAFVDFGLFEPRRITSRCTVTAASTSGSGATPRPG